MSAVEYAEWQAFWALDPWGEQREDMRHANRMWALVAPHTRTPHPAADYLLFPDEDNELPDDAGEDERRWMKELMRDGD